MPYSVIPRVPPESDARCAAAILHRSVQYRSTLDGTFFALSDPTRRGILERLGGGPATISELAEPFGLTINGVKKHVGILERADLVVTEKVGRARHCRLGAGSLAEANAWIEGHRRAWEGRLIAAPPERVFDAFTDPAGQRECATSTPSASRTPSTASSVRSTTPSADKAPPASPTCASG
jgi:DNA-binding transcriptional ArsR family regulator